VDVSNNPLLFSSSDGDSVAGLKDLRSQCLSAESLLINVNDKFTFTPNAANNITISLAIKDLELDYDVQIEILGDGNVNGISRKVLINIPKASIDVQTLIEFAKNKIASADIVFGIIDGMATITYY
jgi:hypothetical protein